MKSLNDVLHLVLGQIFSDPHYSKRLRADMTRFPLVTARAAVRLFCGWVRSADPVTAMQGGVYLVLLWPRIDARLRALVVKELFSTLAAGKKTSQREAAAYALQYSKSERVVQQLKCIAQSPHVSPRLREIADDATRPLEHP